MNIALGYRVQSPIAVRFRRWATQRLHEYIQKGFTMDDERLKQLTSQFLDYAEFQALEQNPMTMVDWIAAWDDQILRLRKNILEGGGSFHIRKPSKRLGGSLKSTGSVRCECWKVISTRW